MQQVFRGACDPQMRGKHLQETRGPNQTGNGHQLQHIQVSSLPTRAQNSQRRPLHQSSSARPDELKHAFG